MAGSASLRLGLGASEGLILPGKIRLKTVCRLPCGFLGAGTAWHQVPGLPVTPESCVFYVASRRLLSLQSISLPDAVSFHPVTPLLSRGQPRTQEVLCWGQSQGDSSWDQCHIWRKWARGERCQSWGNAGKMGVEDQRGFWRPQEGCGLGARGEKGPWRPRQQAVGCPSGVWGAGQDTQRQNEDV